MTPNSEPQFCPSGIWTNPHLQTASRGLLRWPPKVPWQRQYLRTCYGDALSVDVLASAVPAKCRLLFLHGLTGCSGASPIPEVASAVRGAGVETWALNLRGADRTCPEIPRLYHAGCTEDLDSVFEQMPQDLPWRFVGFSLGANLLLKWLGEKGNLVGEEAWALAVSCPFDLAQCSRGLEQTLTGRLYRAFLVRRLKDILKPFMKRYPGVLDKTAVKRARTFWDFDENITSPLHGFAGADDYWARNSSVRFLSGIRVPTILLHALDDPFQPNPPMDQNNPLLAWEVYPGGGHMGFQDRWTPDWLTTRISNFARAAKSN